MIEDIRRLVVFSKILVTHSLAKPGVNSLGAWVTSIFENTSDIFDPGTSMTWALNLKIHRAGELVQHLDLHVFIDHQ